MVTTIVRQMDASLAVYNGRSVCNDCGEQRNQASWARCAGCNRPTCDGCESACMHCGNAAALPRYCSTCFDNPRKHACAGAEE